MFIKECIIPKGQIFVISDGQYDEYEIAAVAKANVTLHMDKIKKEFLDTPEHQVLLYSTIDLFKDWLFNRKKYAKEIELLEVNIEDFYKRPGN